MIGCSAPWYELNVSAPDNNVSACCYYAGAKDVWDDEPRPIEWYWNGENMKALRRLQGAAAPSDVNGCSNCFYYQQALPGGAYYDFSANDPPDGLSELQARNWRVAKAEHAAGADTVSCLPLRIYANFGFSCNLGCTMCHQVPRRRELKRQVKADSILEWGEQLLSSLEVCVIGGEPFALPEALKFIRTFGSNPRFSNVRLSVFTNGTLLHKHWPSLMPKQKLSLAVSLDSIGEGFEKIRLGGKWSDVEQNLLRALEIKAKERPDWQISTTANIQKAGVPFLGQYARWHVKHGIRSFFYDFITAPGVEDTFLRDNFLHNPQLLDGMAGWSDHFDEAISIYRRAGWRQESAQLEQFRERVARASAEKASYIAAMRRQSKRNDWVAQVPERGPKAWMGHVAAYPGDGRDAVPFGTHMGLLAFSTTRLEDHCTIPYIKISPPAGGGQFRIRAHWPKGISIDAEVRLAHIRAQGDGYRVLEAFTEFFDFGSGVEQVLTGALPDDLTEFRVILTPLGEAITVLPKKLEIDFDPDTRRLLELPVHRPLLKRVLGVFARTN